MSFKCGGHTGATDPYRNAAKAADDLAAAIHEMVVLKRELAYDRVITPVEERDLTELLLKLNSADRAFVDQLRGLTSAPDAATQTKLRNSFAEMISAIDALKSDAVPNLKNPDAVSRLNQLVSTMSAAVQVINQALGP
jgi:propanediol dehydratase large subunit